MPDRKTPGIENRRQLFRWLGWFAMANAIIFGLIGLRYLSGGPDGSSALAWIYLVTIYISHHSWLALLPLLLLVSPFILVKPSLRWSRTLAVLLMAIMIAVILLDSLLWSQSRFHINILTLKILGSSSLIFAVIMFVIALLFESLLAGRIWSWDIGPIRDRDGNLLQAEGAALVLPAGQAVEFQVTAEDVNHGFGIYNEAGQIVAQTQPMPGYVNNLVHTFKAAGNYQILCMEYCGLAHHTMVTTITVE